MFSLFYGYAAARNRTARTVLMPVLDVLQSVPILSFLPVVLLSLSAVLPQAFAAEFAAIVLIFTSQAWNMTFSFYQSMTTIPKEMREAAAVFRFDPASAEMVLASYHPGQSVETVRDATGWDLRVARDVRETPTPTADELTVVRDCDREGFWTR